MSNAFNLSQLANNVNSSGQLSASAGVTGTLPIANGGTNNGSLAVTAGGVVYTDGSKLVNVGAGTSGQILTSAGASAPTWATPAGGGGLTAMISYGWQGTASRSGSVMTVTAMNAYVTGIINIGDTIKTDSGTSYGSVVSFGTGTGGTGTYNMSASGTIGSTTAYTSGGSFTVPAGITKILVELCGGGAGQYTYNGAGGYSKGILTVTPGNTITATIGQGYLGTGGTTSFSTISATGGTNSIGGTGSGGSINLTGGEGGQINSGGCVGGGNSGSVAASGEYFNVQAGFNVGGILGGYAGAYNANLNATGYGNGGGPSCPGKSGIVILSY